MVYKKEILLLFACFFVTSCNVSEFKQFKFNSEEYYFTFNQNIPNVLLVGTTENKNLEFTYIGNVPKEVKFKNTIIKNPLSGKNLAQEIKNNNIYLTASKNEPSGNHHIEAAQCGLPILYFNSGGIPEYCEGYGVEFEENFKEKLDEIIRDYNKYSTNLKKYPFSAEVMCKEFFETFMNVLQNKDNSEVKVNKIVKELFVLKNKIQRLVTGFTLKQYIKQKIKRILG